MRPPDGMRCICQGAMRRIVIVDGNIVYFIWAVVCVSCIRAVESRFVKKSVNASLKHVINVHLFCMRYINVRMSTGGVKK